MKQILAISICLASLLVPALICSAVPSTPKIQTLYKSLNRQSIAQLLAFYRLNPQTPEGQQALQQAWNLLSGQISNTTANPLPIGSEHPSIQAIVALVNKQPLEQAGELTSQELEAINTLASRLGNRRLKGSQAMTEEEVLALPPSEIDLAHGLLISQLGQEIKTWNQIHTYEAMIDLMALQILSTLNPSATPQEKIEAINRFIFEEMGFRFPPHSCYAKNVDLYTFLPSVLDSRRGVCLGVSILYLSIAQRLNLELEMITPPGHIYVRYRDDKSEINIETTARGIHLDSETYLGINTRSLQQRNIKEVIGLSHFNQASVYWITGEHKKALDCYSRAQKYIPNDFLLKELMAYNYLLSGNVAEGKRLLQQVQGHIPDYAVAKENVADEYLRGDVDADGIKAVFHHVDETRDSLLEKQKTIEEVLKRYPRFATGWFHLAITYLQLHREGEAFEVLKHYHELQPNDPTAEYYLTVLHATRWDYPQAWEHLKHSEQLVSARAHRPKVLKELRKELSFRYPEYKKHL